MFICAITKKTSKSGEPRIPLVLQTRDVTYVKNLETGKIEVLHGLKRKEELTSNQAFIAYGSEIVKEIGVTEAGLTLYHQALDDLSKEERLTEES